MPSMLLLCHKCQRYRCACKRLEEITAILQKPVTIEFKDVICTESDKGVDTMKPITFVVTLNWESKDAISEECKE